MTELDLVIRNGTVVDGTGGPSARADVGIRDGRIAVVGRVRESAGEEIDADGCIVSPGFVDVHAHMDAQVWWDASGSCSSWHGVTSVAMGNCGFTLAPCREESKDLVLRSFERAEDIPRTAMLEGIEWRWETYAEFLDALEGEPLGINFGGYVGHSALRTYAMGERAFEEAASHEHLDAMAVELESALRAGALGLSTSRTTNHETADDRPVPSRQASWQEVEALVGVMGRLGAGVFELANERPTTTPERREYHGRLEDLAVRSGRPLTYVGGAQEWLDLCDRVGAGGGSMVAQVSPRPMMNLIGFRTKLPFDALPGWAEIRRLPLTAQRRAFEDVDRRAALVEVASTSAEYPRAIGAEVRPPDYSKMLVLDSGPGPWSTVEQLAAQRRVPPVDLLVDLSLASGFDLFFGQPLASTSLDLSLALLRHPRTVVGGTDTGAHVSQIIDFSMPTFLLGYWVRQRRALSWEEAIRLLTFAPSSLLGLDDRGLVREGFAADLVVLDPDRIGPELPYVAHDLPGGAPRLKQAAAGIEATIVNGAVTLRGGQETGARPGVVLRGPLHRGRPVPGTPTSERLR